MIYTNPEQFHRLHETQVVHARGVRDDPKVLAALQRGPIFGASGGSGNVAANVFRLRSSGHNIRTHYVRTAQNKMVSVYELQKPVVPAPQVPPPPHPSTYDFIPQPAAPTAISESERDRARMPYDEYVKKYFW